MKKEKLLSVIIPNYNSGDLLKECISSIVINMNKYVEVIVIDDGSTDNSLKKIDEFSDTVKIIRQTNSGVSSARNRGLKEAVGKYIMFVDADDTLNQTWCNIVFQELSKDKDLIIFNYTKNDNKLDIIDAVKLLESEQLRGYKSKMLKLPTLYMTVWGKVFKRSIIVNNKILFDERLNLAEDGDFMIQILLKTNSILLNNYILYHYRNNSNSVMRTFNNNKVSNYLRAMKISSCKIPSGSYLEEAFNFYVLMHLNVMMVHEVFDRANNISYLSKMKKLKRILKTDIINNSLRKIRINKCKEKQTIPILLLKLKLYDIAALAFILRSKHNHEMITKK
ncbi:glycosyltransferase family 2 protein [Limosilactobacillus fastidiosus]|uniref:Glycosyltransferase n=1 Tax=Limosilactobacillus fastidiosus TaxID=2759855 RepID=A0ABR6E8L0_9LACO|nr:glycosyltransferase [Limosilactobacillus fastidiosus]MBB1063536.1 glycosyltransferase [Limosilactobacillus fastidiosus]MCD7084883.1 glycosyltransferase [Limosilactobacillus fastidiosus]